MSTSPNIPSPIGQPAARDESRFAGSYPWLALASLALGVTLFLTACRIVGSAVPWRMPDAMLIAGAVGVVAMLVARVQSYLPGRAFPSHALTPWLLGIIVTALACCVAYRTAHGLMVPGDVLSSAESAYVDDILKVRAGGTPFAHPGDPDADGQGPGGPILTYLIASIVGRADSIPAYRVIQFGYVVLASLLAVGVCDLLARLMLTAETYQGRWLWLAVWWPILLFLCVEPAFNRYTYTLHADGLALLVSVGGFWLMARHAFRPRGWQLVLMAVLPAAGFFVKQHMLVWAGLFLVYLMIEGRASWRHRLICLFTTLALTLMLIGVGRLVWGSSVFDWAFTAHGAKACPACRGVDAFLSAGIYFVMGAFVACVIVFRRPARGPIALWLLWLAILGLGAFMYGTGSQVGDLGPGVVLAGCWFLVSLAGIWPRRASDQPAGAAAAQQLTAAAGVLMLFGSLGLFAAPTDPVPADLGRCITEPKRESEGHTTDALPLDRVGDVLVPPPKAPPATQPATLPTSTASAPGSS